MDVSKVSTGSMVFIGGSVLFAIASFLDWFSFGSVFGVSLPGASANGFDAGFLWCTLWFVVFLGAAVVLALPAFGVAAPKLPAVSYVAAGALGSIFVLLKLIIGIEFYDRSAGIYIGLVAALVVTCGGFLVYTESGGTIDDLKNIDKLRGSLHHVGSGDASPPPPPPPPPMG
jgi:hypothetical protein